MRIVSVKCIATLSLFYPLTLSTRNVIVSCDIALHGRSEFINRKIVNEHRINHNQPVPG
jgi:hypothetical protein